MLHPSHELRFINSAIGYGIFATEPIPKGTIIVFSDSLDIKILPRMYARFSEKFREIVESFTYIDKEGQGVLPWDNAKYLNHSCEPNILLTPYLFFISTHDIAESEQITTDYGLLQAYLDVYQQGEFFSCQCGSSNCRKIANFKEIEQYLPLFIACLSEALSCLFQVKQPLLNLINTKEKNELIKALQNQTDCSKLMLDFLKKRKYNFQRKWGKLFS